MVKVINSDGNLSPPPFRSSASSLVLLLNCLPLLGGWLGSVARRNAEEQIGNRAAINRTDKGTNWLINPRLELSHGRFIVIPGEALCASPPQVETRGF